MFALIMCGSHCNPGEVCFIAQVEITYGYLFIDIFLDIIREQIHDGHISEITIKELKNELQRFCSLYRHLPP